MVALQNRGARKKAERSARKRVGRSDFAEYNECVKNKNTPLNQYRLKTEENQVVLTVDHEILLPEDSPVRMVNAQLEELEYGKLYAAYSSKGRKSTIDPRVMFKVMAYGYMCEIYSSRKLEEACRYRVDFMWLLDGEEAPDHSTIARFRTGRCMEAAEDLFYQYVRKLEEQGETDRQAVFIDGTKLESRAGRYTFVWRKSTEKKLAKVKEAVPYESVEELKEHLTQEREKISFVRGIGHRKSEAQREWERLDGLRAKWEQYEEELEIMGEGRNSYSKTDPDATFMRMKEDHMRNGQLKPAYNVQIAVNSEYITGIEVFSDRTDFHTMKPFLRKLEQAQRGRYEEVTADAGYESEENYLHLEQSGQMSFIKPANHEQKKTKKFKKQIGRIENMDYDEMEDCFICANGRKLPLRRESTELQNGQEVTTAWYRCEDCTGCPHRSQCCQAKDPEQPKELKLRKTFWKMREQSQRNIETERGIYLRLCRSIQVEGAFGLLKNDFGFRRFLTRGKKNVRTELFFLALAFDLKKLYMKREKGRLQTHLSEVMIA